MKKIFTLLSIFTCIVFTMIILSGIDKEYASDSRVRTVNLVEKELNYEGIFEQYDDAVLDYSKEEGKITFSGTLHYNEAELSDIDLVSITSNNSDTLDVRYSFDYDFDNNIFYLNVEATNIEEGTVLDRVVGVPFSTNNDDIDIVFDVDGDYILLSELGENELIQNCGWFKKLLKKVAIAAAVVAVAAVVVVACVYAAPAVIAAGSAIAAASSTALAAGAGTVAIAGATAGGIAASTAATLATVGAVAATTAIAASATAATAYLTSCTCDAIDRYNEKLSTNTKWTTQELDAALAKAIQKIDNNEKNTVVYLGRFESYLDVAKRDKENNVIYFYLDDWMAYENKHTAEGMWVLNCAFLDYCIAKEKSDGWEFRLTTDYHSYIPAKKPGQDGYFYSK